MSEAMASREQESKRMKDFKNIAENWESIPEYDRGRLDGMVSTLSAVYLRGNSNNETRK